MRYVCSKITIKTQEKQISMLLDRSFTDEFNCPHKTKDCQRKILLTQNRVKFSLTPQGISVTWFKMEITHHINLGLDEFVLINNFPFSEASSIRSDIIPTKGEKTA